MNQPKGYAATPHAALIAELLDSRVAKTEREHAAAREIERLREVLPVKKGETEMTAKELIEFLSSVPPDTVISVPGYEGGVKDVQQASLIQVLLNVNHDWYYGAHSEDDEDTRALHEDEGVALTTAQRVVLK